MIGKIQILNWTAVRGDLMLAVWFVRGAPDEPAHLPESELRRGEMGSNPTQAKGVLLFFLGSTLIAAGAAGDGSVAPLLAGLALVALSIAVFLKCKPWEDTERPGGIQR
jgi:hypothetical protein